ncbi:hypothetical protein FSP39_000008 [Pinctada imbricata]|uniref:Glucose-methanol-choline oxidoreductase N-terminal domain-containing protein n=1 Tax=Pinctada imbricata TaxID=66713 RepID=A0AA88YJT5_PINIB|nr:hypothetical protein FSP39_000008 [Pinctada imbricata]
MRKLSTRWVPRLLTGDQKHTRHTFFEGDPINFLQIFVTMGETWANQLTQKPNNSGNTLAHPGQRRLFLQLGRLWPRFSGSRRYSADRLSPKWTNNQWLILYFFYVFASLLTQLREYIKLKRRGKLIKFVLFNQDNAPVHKSVSAMSSIHDCGLNLIEHPTYSPDLASSDFHLFPKLKAAFSGTHFQSYDDAIFAVNGFLNNQDNGFFKSGYEPLTLTTMNGVRCSTSTCFLQLAYQRPNLHISVNSHVTKVLIKDKSAFGVEFIRGGRKHRIHARREIILSAGAINTPQLLMLSGIGPKNHLQALKTEGNILKIAERNRNAFLLVIALTRPKSKGTITLQSTDPFDHPLIDPQYLTDKSDVDTLVTGVKMSLEVGNTESFKQLGINLDDTHLHFSECTNYEKSTDDYFECIVHHYAVKGDHPTATFGSGSGGGVVATRLSEDPSVTVLLLEAGPSDEHYDDILVPANGNKLHRTEVDWKYATVPQKESLKVFKDNIVFWPRGRVLGGTSSINNMVYVRGSRYDYDEWAAEGCDGWSYKDVLPYFIKSEDNRVPWLQDSPYHGKGGPLKVSPGQVTELNTHYSKAMQELGYDTVDSNGENQIGMFNKRAHVCNHPRSPTDIQRGQVVGTLSSLKRFGQGPSWSPVVTVSQSASLKDALVQDFRLVKYQA